MTHLCPGPVDTEFQDVARREGHSERKHAPDWVKVPVEQVARVALRAVSRDGARAIPGFWMMLAPFFFALVPLFALRLFYAPPARPPGHPQPRTA